MKRTTIATAAATVVAAIAISAAAVLAVPAGAADTYTPALAPKATTSVKVAVDEAAAYTASAAKRVAAVARKRTAKRAAARKVTTVSSTSAGTSDAARAQSVLAGLIAKYPILAGTTVEMGDARGYQAIAYYSSGRIIISRTHTASIERILNHEVWHVIDYRDNGSINWGENLPPANASSFAN